VKRVWLKKIYLITHLYNIDDKLRTCKLESFLKENFDVEIYMPYRDSKEENIDKNIWKQEIFYQDIKALNEADIILGYVDGPDFDEGIGFEIGYARTIGKTVIILNSDFIKYRINGKISNKIDPLIDFLGIKFFQIKYSLDFENFCKSLEEKYSQLLNLVDLDCKGNILNLKKLKEKNDYFIETGNEKFFYYMFYNSNISQRLYTFDAKEDLNNLLTSKKVYIYSNGMQMHFGSAIIVGICYALKIPFFIINDRLIYIKGKELMKANLMIDVACEGYIDVRDFINEFK